MTAGWWLYGEGPSTRQSILFEAAHVFGDCRGFTTSPVVALAWVRGHDVQFLAGGEAYLPEAERPMERNLEVGHE